MSGTPNRKATGQILYRLADNVKRMRAARGYTQDELARICGFEKSYVSRVEQAIVNITLANLQALAVGLGCTESELLMRRDR